jgi:hypothetical protein
VALGRRLLLAILVIIVLLLPLVLLLLLLLLLPLVLPLVLLLLLLQLILRRRSALVHRGLRCEPARCCRARVQRERIARVDQRRRVVVAVASQGPELAGDWR